MKNYFSVRYLKKISALILIASITFSVIPANALEMQYLRQKDVQFGETSECMRVGKGQEGGVCLNMPKNHPDMMMTFFWDEGGVVSFLFYDYSGKLVWDSLDDAPWYDRRRYAVHDERPINTYFIGSNVEKVVVYCSSCSLICTDSYSASSSITYGRTCSYSAYSAGVSYTNVRRQ